MNPTWSLATEEQFCLMWPALFAFFSRREQVIRALLVAIGCVWIDRTVYLFVIRPLSITFTSALKRAVMHLRSGACVRFSSG